MASTRRLAAILAADVAGYSRLMGEDEEGTLARLKAIRREVADPKIKEHHGPVVKTTRLAEIESRLSSSVAPKRSGPSGPGAGTCFQPGYPRILGIASLNILCRKPSSKRAARETKLW